MSIPWRGVYKVSALIGRTGICFSPFGFPKGERKQKRKRNQRGLSTSSRNRRWLGLQVFALTRTVRSSFPHAATAARGPRPSGLPLKTTTQGRASPYVENPRERPQEGCCGEWDIPTHAVFLLYGPDTWPARVSNSSKAFNQRCRGRLSRRPADIPRHYCRGQRPARPIHRIPEHLSLDAVGAASLGRPIFK